MPAFRLESLYEDPDRIVVTAHRGFSGRYPENTLMAFDAAIDVGADLVEFDLRGTRDDVPIVLHDPTLDRTSGGTGASGDYTLAELRELNFSYWDRSSGTEQRLAEPAYPDVTIPTFEEVLELTHGRVGLNIQVYETRAPVLAEICRLYDHYGLHDQGYLTMSTYDDAELVRAVNPEIELCVLERQGTMDEAALWRMKAFGCKYIQPTRQDVSPESCRVMRELGLYANMFYSNTDEDNRRYISYGLQGILTDYPDVLLGTLRELGLR